MQGKVSVSLRFSRQHRPRCLMSRSTGEWAARVGVIRWACLLRLVFPCCACGWGMNVESLASHARGLGHPLWHCTLGISRQVVANSASYKHKYSRQSTSLHTQYNCISRARYYFHRTRIANVETTFIVPAIAPNYYRTHLSQCASQR